MIANSAREMISMMSGTRYGARGSSRLARGGRSGPRGAGAGCRGRSAALAGACAPCRAAEPPEAGWRVTGLGGGILAREQHQLAARDRAAALEPREVDASRQPGALSIGAVPGHGVVSGRQLPVD